MKIGTFRFVLIAAVVTTGLYAIPAHATTQQGTYSNWRAPAGAPAGGWEGIGEYVYPVNDPKPTAGQAPQAYFYSNQFGVSTTGGYVGIQTDINGKRAIFSLWGATSATCSPVPGAICQPFGGEGTGYQTLIPYAWQAGVRYFTYVSRDPNQCNKWNGSISDGSTTTAIGSIVVPGCGGITDGNSTWVEWYAANPADCSGYPSADVYFYPTRYDRAANVPGEYSPGTDSDNVTDGTCSSAIVNDASPWKHHHRGFGPVVNATPPPPPQPVGGLRNVRNVNSGLVVDVPYASTADGAQVIQYPLNSPASANQQWRIRLVSAGRYRIVNRNSGAVLDVVGSSTLDSAAVDQHRWTGTASQLWYVEPSGSGYRLRNVNSGRCLDVPYSSTDPGTGLIQYLCTGNPNQQWTLPAAG